MIWDRRATSRHVASESYIQAVDVDDVPWGGALRLDQAIDMERNEAYGTSTNSYIRVMRYSRDHRGMLAVLSRSGQLKVLSTHKEFVSHEFDDEDGGPELLEVRRSHEMDHQYMDPARNRIVSFDWINLRSPVLRPRMLVLRASGDFEVIEQPSFTSDHLFKLVPWSAPYRGLEGRCPLYGQSSWPVLDRG